ncbi:MAG: tripartite tricarboxylate transporter substrate binding protein [Rhodoferax sp.]|nr:tripartite tricarboxylate transporter substrate binding protein [Rhodoferax sp.]
MRLVKLLSLRSWHFALPFVALGLALWHANAHAQDKKPITWYVGFAPGGTVDVLTRAVARQLSELSGQPVVVENRPGASGALALQQIARAAPDGNTLCTLPGPSLYSNPVPQVGKELRAVAMMATGPMVLVGPAANARTDVSALFKAMREAPKEWSYASSGNGTSQHLAGELLNQMAGTQAVHIPYKGGGPAVADLLGGQVPLAMLGAAPVLPHIKSGKLKAYAVTSKERLALLPQVPTLQESALNGYAATQWFAVVAPAGTLNDRILQLHAWIGAALKVPAIDDLVQTSGNVRASGTPQEVEAFLTDDNRRWSDLATKLKLKTD